jgi:hypothetical protein
MADAAALKQYAERHGLVYETGKPITTQTPFTYTSPSDHSLTGTLPGGFEGTVALMSYEAEDGTARETLCLTEIPESIAFLPKLFCRDAAYKHTRSYTLGAEGFESDYRDTGFESEAVNRTWAVQVTADQDEGWLRELFIPTFLDWLGERSPQDFTFELVEGDLCCRVAGEADEAEELDRLCELTAHVAERIRTESLEEERPRAAFSAPLPTPKETPERRAADAAVAKLDWDEPPKDMMTAVRAYHQVASRAPGGWTAAILLGGGVGLLVVMVTVPFGLLFGFADFGTFGALISAVGAAIAGVWLGGFLFSVARRSQVQRRAQRYGQRAFVHQYARSRRLDEEDARAFHARFLHLDLPGPARNVMFGRHPATGRETRVLLCSDPSRQSPGFEVAVVEAPAGAAASLDPPTDETTKLELHDGYIVAHHPTAAGVGPSVAGLDALCRIADAAASGSARVEPYS